MRKLFHILSSVLLAVGIVGLFASVVGDSIAPTSIIMEGTDWTWRMVFGPSFAIGMIGVVVDKAFVR